MPRAKADGHREGLQRDHRRHATTTSSSSTVPGRRRHLDQHERQRGDRQRRDRAMATQKGEYESLHPNDHVNMSQSTNDAYPTRSARDHPGERAADRRAATSCAYASTQGGRVRRRPQDGPHAAPGRGADDARARSSTRSAHARRRHRAPPRRSSLCPRGQHGRDRDRHRDQHRRATPRSRSSELGRAAASRSCPATTCSRRPRTSGAFVLYSGAARSVAVKLSKICNDLCCSLRVRVPGSARSTCRRTARLLDHAGKVNPVIPRS